MKLRKVKRIVRQFNRSVRRALKGRPCKMTYPFLPKSYHNEMADCLAWGCKPVVPKR